MNKHNTMRVSREQKKEMLDEIQFFFQKERDENIGIIASEAVLDFFFDILGDYIYNKAMDDTLMWYKRTMENVESDFYALYKNK